ncbi:hypothetical protein BCR42DRAFT_24434 [Absidia repens]|uniref:Uncharacterized protein n=1 Tax=Absidia repens TaxID=90262 RepID=A0A1X2II65_9FUNG|nr:hypothetical protein BCR42DRAFT_24434 [Absidia repens]
MNLLQPHMTLPSIIRMIKIRKWRMVTFGLSLLLLRTLPLVYLKTLTCFHGMTITTMRGCRTRRRISGHDIIPLT